MLILSRLSMREKLKEQNMDLKKLSSLTRIPESRLKKIFTGKEKVTFLETMHIAEALKCSVSDFTTPKKH